MEVVRTAPLQDVTRKGRSGRKSRNGCPNCKMRRVKCDESRPQCQKCRSYGVLCNYGSEVADLIVPGEQPSKLKGHLKLHNHVETPLPSLEVSVIVSDASSSFKLDAECIDLLDRFRSQTLSTMGSTAMVQLYETEIVKLAFAHPFLMHSTLAIAATHDRLLRAPEPKRRTLREDFHWTQCVTLFNHKLNQPIQLHDRDPLWAAAATLGVISFSSLEATSPEEAWPLNPAVSGGIEWLNMTRGKMAVWNLVDPLRPDSIFHVLRDEYLHLLQPLPEVATEHIPADLKKLCAVNESSTTSNNSYFAAIQGLMQLLNSPDKRQTLTRTLAFAGHMQESFKALLAKKDPIALLLMALWFSQVRGVVWWLEQRATVEGRAICLYLRKHHGNNRLIQQLLPRTFPQADIGVTFPAETVWSNVAQARPIVNAC